MSEDQIRRVTMPKWGLSMASGKITEWIAAEGETVARGDDLVEIDTDKIAGSLESDGDGVLRRVIAAVGEDVPVGGTIALIAPAEVTDEDIERAATEAREELDSGAVEEVAGPVVGKVTVDGRNIAYATLGADEQHVVLVHGFGGDKNSWLFVQEPLSEHHTVHAIDLAGHGESTKDVGDGAVGTLGAMVTGFLAEQGIERAHLVGHSLGGAAVVAAAVGEPGRVASLTLVAPAGFGSKINADYLRGFAHATSRRELKPHLTALFADPAQATRQFADDLMKFKRLEGVDQALETLLGTMLDGDGQRIDAVSLLAETDVPIAVVWGSEDAVIPAENGGTLEDRAEVRYVEGAGHMVLMEKPGTVVAAVQSLTGGG